MTTQELSLRIAVNDRELRRLQNQLGRTSSSFGGLGKAARLAGLGAAAGVGALATVLGASLKQAANFEASLNKMQAISKATASEMKEISATAKRLGADVKLPGASAADAADAMTELAKAGFTARQSMDAARGVLVLSAAAGIENARAAEIASNALNAFKLKAKDVVYVNDLLANTANTSSVEIEDVAEAFKEASAVFANFQGPVVGSKNAMADLSTAIALLGNAGLKGSSAGNALKMSLLQLSRPVDKNKTALRALYLAANQATIGEEQLRTILRGSKKDRAEAIEEIEKQNKLTGLQGDIAYDASGRMRGFEEILKLTAKATKGMTDEQRNSFLGLVFGQNAIKAILPLINAEKGAWDKARDAVTEKGAADRLAQAKMKGLKGAIEAFKSAIETLAITVGTPFLNATTRVVQAISGIVNKVDAFVPKVQAAFEAAFSPRWSGDLEERLRVLGDNLAGPTGAKIGGALGGIALKAMDFGRKALPVMKSAIEGIAKVVAQVAPKIAAFFGKHIAPAVRDLLGAFKDLRPFLQNVVVPLLKGLAETVLAGLVVALKIIVPIVTTVAKVLGWLGQKAAPLKGTFELIGNILGVVLFGAVLKVIGAVLKMLPVIGRIVQVFGRVWNVAKTVGGIFKTVASTYVAGLRLAFSKLGGVLGRFTSGPLGAVRSSFGFLRTSLAKVWSWIKKVIGLANPLKKAFGLVSGAVSKVSGFIGGAVGALGGGDGVVSRATKAIKVAKHARTSGRAGAGGLKGMVMDELALAQSMGLTLTSGYRPGSTTSTGNPSLHGAGQAIDVAGTGGQMAAFARAVAGRAGVAEVIYTPVGAWYPGVGWVRPTGSVAADHYDHVHVGVRSGDGLVGTNNSIPTRRFPARTGDGLAARSIALNKRYSLGAFSPGQKAAPAVDAMVRAAQAVARVLPRLALELTDKWGRVVGTINVQKIKTRLAGLRAALKEAVKKSDVDRIRTQMEKLEGHITAALEQVKERFTSAFGAVTERALRTFDAVTSKHLDNVAVRYDDLRSTIDSTLEASLSGIEAFRNELTASERQLNDVRALLDSQQAAESRSDADAELRRERDRLALLQQRGASAKAIAEQEEKVEEARRRVRDLDLQEQIDALEEKAEAERAARDKEADARRDAAEKAADQRRRELDEQQRIEELEYQARREEQRLAFERRLADMQTQAEREKWTQARTLKEMTALFAEYGVDFTQAGVLLGSAFSEAFKTQLDDLVKNALPQYVKTITTVASGGTTSTSSTGGGGGTAVVVAAAEAAVTRKWEEVNKHFGLGTSTKKLTGGGGGGMMYALASGGVVRRPVTALIGEAGPEAVIPLDRLMSTLGPQSRGGDTYIFEFPNYAGDKKELAETIRRELNRHGRRGAKLWAED